MAASQFSLSWDAHKRNICTGLSNLQQNGEFVDMTLAADGHLVKVHQVIMALASPYIKDLLASADCKHPVIFLNKISYTTLCSILEYIYTGEVLVSMDNLNDLMEAGKELHIKGLEDMVLHDTISSTPAVRLEKCGNTTKHELDEVHFLEIPSSTKIQHRNADDTDHDALSNSESMDTSGVSYTEKSIKADMLADTKNACPMQYTVSNQGSLQMVLNRFLYYLKHTNRDETRQWRCVDYLNTYKCPAYVITKGDVVVQRISAHTHSFHDKKILKKVRDGAIFTAIQEAEREGLSKKHRQSAGDD